MDFFGSNDNLSKLPHFMGKSPKISKIFNEVKKIAPQNVTALISGEDGTCKELVAKAIHYNSQKNSGPFITCNLSSIPKEFAEIELFGDGKTISSRTSKRKIGKIESAHKGTLFIDEISGLDMPLQEKLFLFIQGKSVCPRGCDESIKSDARIIGATSKNTKDIFYNGNLKKELCDVFSSHHIMIPPLRERKEDILYLAGCLLEEVTEKYKTGPKRLSKDAKNFLLNYHWPCNMTELEHMMKRAAILSQGDVINKKDLLVDDISSCSIREFLEMKLKRYIKEMTKLDKCNLHDTVLSEVENSLITIVLKETEGNQLRAAKTLGINRNTLRAKIKEYKIHI